MKNVLTLGISTRALFDLEEENKVFENEGVAAYNKFQREREKKNVVLNPGPAFPLIKKMLDLNRILQGHRIEVVIMSKNSPEISTRIFRACEYHRLDINEGVFRAGGQLAPIIMPFQIDLFLSKDKLDVEMAVADGFAAAEVYPIIPSTDDLEELRIVFDGDAVIFSDHSEEINQHEGLEAFKQHEKLNADIPLEAGPFAEFLSHLNLIQKSFAPGKSPLRTYLLTARTAPADERAIKTLRDWGITVDEAFFVGGRDKSEFLQAIGAHIFFDDKDENVLNAANKQVLASRVPRPKRAVRTRNELPLFTKTG